MSRTNEQVLDLFADLLEPCSEIFMDEEVKNMVMGNASKIEITRKVIKNHKKSIISILALIEGVNPDEYHIDPLMLPLKVIGFLNKPEVNELFISQGQRKDSESSGSATVNTGVAEN